jgi:bacterioferritin
MQGNNEIIAELNKLLVSERQAHDQYLIHSRYWEFNGFEKLFEFLKDFHIDESEHAKKLQARLFLFDAIPDYITTYPVDMSTDIKQQINYNISKEIEAKQMYTKSIQICIQLGDLATMNILNSILKEEDTHQIELEAELNNIEKMGLENYYAFYKGDKK